LRALKSIDDTFVVDGGWKTPKHLAAKPGTRESSLVAQAKEKKLIARPHGSQAQSSGMPLQKQQNGGMTQTMTQI